MAAEGPSQPITGTTIGRYVIDERIAVGGMGIVYRARLRGAHGFERKVAVKTIHSSLVTNEAHRSRFLDEARIAAAISHDNVVQVLDVCDEDGLLFLALEWIDGASLRALHQAADKRGTRVPLDIVVRVIVDVLEGLHHAHELKDDSGNTRKLVHRDVSPENIMVTDQGRAKLIDFGLAKVHDQIGKHTTSSEVLGKVAFMPPEQARTSAVDRRTDIWSVGAVLRLLATGTLAYSAPSDLQRIYKLTLGQEPDPLPDDTPPWLARICSRAMSVAPENRFATCALFRDALLADAKDQNQMASMETVSEYVRAASHARHEPPRGRPVPPAAKQSAPPSPDQSETRPDLPPRKLVEAEQPPPPSARGRPSARYVAIIGALKPGYQMTSDLKLVRRLGAGGMGTIWVADHAKLHTEVVVKFLSESLTSDSSARQRFSREVASTAKVRSPHVVQMLDHGITETGVPFLVMELLDGRDLSKTLRIRGHLDPHEALHVIEGVAAALDKAHERGIIHRDLKPANVFLCSGSPKPFVKLVDFGIAKRLEDETMTATNALVGTPAYMSPEQINGAGDIDHRCDLWALGILAYHMLTGTPPFRADSLVNMIYAISSIETPKATNVNPELPPEIDAWMDRALAKDINARFGSARELAETLAIALGDLSSPPKPRDGSFTADARSHDPPTTTVVLTPSGPTSPDASLTFGLGKTEPNFGRATTPPDSSARSSSGVGIVPVILGVVLLAIVFGLGGLASRHIGARSSTTSTSSSSAPAVDSTTSIATSITSESATPAPATSSEPPVIATSVSSAKPRRPPLVRSSAHPAHSTAPPSSISEGRK